MRARRLANLFLILMIIPCVLIAGYGILVFDQVITFGWSGVLFAFVFPLCGIVFFLSILKLKEELRNRVVLLLLSTLFSIYFIEAGLTFLSPRISNVSIDSQSIINRVEQLRRQGENATVNIVPHSFLKYHKREGNRQILFPLGGIADSLIVFCNEIGEWVSYQSDEHGFHNPKGLYDNDKVTIASIGDSFAQGECVKSEKNMVHLLRNRFPKTINFGMTSNGPLAELASLREYAKPLKPRIVLWFYYEGNDLSDLEREKQDTILIQYLDSDYSQDLLKRRVEIQKFLVQYAEHSMKQIEKETERKEENLHNYLWYARKHPLFKFITLNQVLGRLGLFPTSREEIQHVDLKLFKNILAQAKGEINGWGGKMYFIYLCQKNRFSRFGSPVSQRQKVMEIVNSLDIALIDTYQTFNTHPNPRSLYQGHYTEEGYSLIANQILKTLEQ